MNFPVNTCCILKDNWCRLYTKKNHNYFANQFRKISHHVCLKYTKIVADRTFLFVQYLIKMIWYDCFTFMVSRLTTTCYTYHYFCKLIQLLLITAPLCYEYVLSATQQWHINSIFGILCKKFLEYIVYGFREITLVVNVSKVD